MAEKRKYKVWRARPDSSAGMQVTEKAAFVIGNNKNFVAASNSGVALIGKSVSFGTTSENIRQGGLFLQMNDFLQMIPSTIITPQAKLMPFPPLGMVPGIMQDVPFFTTMLV